MSIKRIDQLLICEGMIHYCFKGMQMSRESARVVEKDEDHLIVERDSDRQLFTFLQYGKQWLLKDHHTSKSLLFGTEFVCNENKNF
jgi:hypothetical protein